MRNDFIARADIHFFRRRNHRVRRFLDVSVMTNNPPHAFCIDRIEFTTHSAQHLLAIEHRFAFAIQFDRIALVCEPIDAIVKSFHPSIAFGKKTGNDERM